MKALKITILLFGVSLFSFAQNADKIAKTITGKVVNSATNEVISYTNIGIEGTLHGTASDGEGNFELKIPASMVSKNIFFSAVGYKNKIFPVKSLFERAFNVVKIEPQSYNIDDIDVAGQSKVLIRILRMAAENTPYNFINGPFNLYANYHTTHTINDSIEVNDQAKVLMFDETGYSNPSKQNAFQHLNYQLTKDKTDADYRFSSNAINIDELLLLDWVRTGSSVLNAGLLAGFQLQLEEEPNINGKDYWVIAFKQEKPTLAGSGNFYATSFSGKITIAKEDYSVLKIQGKQKSVKNSRQGNSLAVDPTNTNALKNISSKFEVSYKNLTPEKINLSETYESNGNKISESSSLTIKQVKTTYLQVLKSRDYIAEK